MNVSTARAVVELPRVFHSRLHFGWALPWGPKTSQLGTEEANPLQNRGIFFEERRAGMLMRECELVNGTLVALLFTSPACAARNGWLL
jgi:hypothetical protein